MGAIVNDNGLNYVNKAHHETVACVSTMNAWCSSAHILLAIHDRINFKPINVVVHRQFLK